MKWVSIAVFSLVALFIGVLGACCVSVIIPKESPDRGLQQGFAVIGWILLPIWTGLFVMLIRQIFLIVTDRD